MLALMVTHENESKDRPKRLRRLTLEAKTSQEERLLALLADIVGNKGSVSITIADTGDEHTFSFGD